MEFQRRDLGDRRETLDPVDLEIGLAIARNRHEFEQIGRSRHGMALKELLARVAVRRPDNRTRPALDVVEKPRPDSLVVARKIELGHGCRIRRVGPERLVRLADQHTHDDRFA